MIRTSIAIIVTLLGASGGTALARDPDEAATRPATLKIGLEAVAASFDPHLYNSLENASLTGHVFEALVKRDRSLQPVPELAAKWQTDQDRTWTFTLRGGVKFHDGTTLDARDAIYSFCRIAHLPGSNFVGALRGIVSAEAADPLTLVVRTAVPDPLVPRNLMNAAIVAAPEGWNGTFQATKPETCGSSDRFRAAEGYGPAIIGSGPYRVGAFVPGDRAELEIFLDHWNGKPAWHSVSLMALPDPVARNRALIGGNVDVINAVSPDSMAYFATLPDVRLVVGPQSRTLLLNLNQRPGALGSGGKDNPLSDVRVREAVSLAIDRQAIDDRLYGGTGVPANQLIPPDLMGFVPDLPDVAYNPAQARELLRRAGYGNGFQVEVLSSEANRKLAEVIVRYLAAVDIHATVRLIANAELIGYLARHDFEIQLGAALSLTGEFAYVARESLATQDPVAGMGTQNYGGFTSPELDRLIQKALTTVATDNRLALLREIAVISAREVVKVPLLHAPRIWAVRTGLAFGGRSDGLTLAQDIHPAH